MTKKKQEVLTRSSKPAPPSSKTLTGPLSANEHPRAEFARTTLRPTVQAAVTLQEVNKNLGEVPLQALVDDLSAQCRKVREGNLARPESMLVAQAHTLDALFNFLARRALTNMGERTQTAELYMRLALKAQAQARATVESLVEMKNPKPVAFVKQANIANGPQQVNNVADSARAENSQTEPNKLLESSDGERMDFGTPSATGATNPPLETVGAVHRTTDCGRKGDSRA